MKIFAYSVREYDELNYFLRLQKELGFEFGYTTQYPSAENAALAKGAEALSIITNPMPAELIDVFSSYGVRYISTRSIGYDHIDVDHAHKIGMKISNVSYSPDSVANYTIMLMLMACRKFKYIIKKAELQCFDLEGKIGRELSQCTVGIIGTGRIGEVVIKRLKAFGCRLLAYDIYEKNSLKEYCEYVPLETLMKESDIISLHCPSNASNHHMINAEAIAEMKDGAIIVNAARGSLVDTQALINGITSGKIGAAALDTFEHEIGLCYKNLEHTIMDNSDRAILNSFQNVILSPHMAFYTEEAVADMVGNSVKGLIAFSKNESTPFEVKD